jgi:hypothetical protein
MGYGSCCELVVIRRIMLSYRNKNLARVSTVKIKIPAVSEAGILYKKM